MKNRMRESRSFGSVRGEGGNVLAYSEQGPPRRLLDLARERKVSLYTSLTLLAAVPLMSASSIPCGS